MAVHEIIEQAEHEALQRIIDEQEGLLGIEESRRLGEASPEDMEAWERLLKAIPVTSGPPKRRRWKRLLVAVAVLMALLVISSIAFHVRILNVVEGIQEKFTQIQVSKSAEEMIEGWAGAYILEPVPPGYFYSDAVDAGDYKAVEYANSEGGRFTFYQSADQTGLRIDTEGAVSTPVTIGAIPAKIIFKNELATLTWTDGQTYFSIEYCPQQVGDAQAIQFAQSVTPKKK